MRETIRTIATGLYGYIATYFTLTTVQDILGIIVGLLTSIFLIIKIYKALKNK